jgi:hypothetical protein
MAAKLTRLTQKIAIQLHLVAEGERERCTIWSFRSRHPVRKLLDSLSYITTLCERLQDFNSESWLAHRFSTTVSASTLAIKGTDCFTCRSTLKELLLT